MLDSRHHAYHTAPNNFVAGIGPELAARIGPRLRVPRSSAQALRACEAGA
jgi:hypothetical protein